MSTGGSILMSAIVLYEIKIAINRITILLPIGSPRSGVEKARSKLLLNDKLF